MIRIIRELAAVLAGSLMAAATATADIPVSYDSDFKVLKNDLRFGDPVTFDLFGDSACAGGTLHSEILEAGTSDVSIERIEPISLNGQKPRSKTIARIRATLITPLPLGAVFLRVTGFGIFAVGSDCQQQVASAGFSAGANFDASSSGVALGTADAIIASVTITAPAAGLAIVNANGWFNLKNSVTNHARCSVTTGVFVETATAIRARFPTFTSDLFVPMARTRVFPLVGPGSVTFNLVCDKVVGDIDINDVAMSAIYVPVTY